MNRKMGYIVIAVGIALVILGIVLLNKHNTIETPVATSSKPRQAIVKTDDYEENNGKGDAFEQFVVKNFDKAYFTLQEWRSDKYVDGIYPVSNHFPDLEVIFTFKSKGFREAFAVECKWR
jgi:hypothetical protein